MKYNIVFLLLIGAVTLGNSVLAATMTCQVRSVEGGTVVLEDCDVKRASDFSPGDKVKVKLQKKNVKNP